MLGTELHVAVVLCGAEKIEPWFAVIWKWVVAFSSSSAV